MSAVRAEEYVAEAPVDWDACLAVDRRPPSETEVIAYKTDKAGETTDRLYRECLGLPEGMLPMMAALSCAEWLITELYKYRERTWPRPYFGVSVDYGIDIYWERHEDLVKAHVSPSGSVKYVYTVLDNESNVDMNPSADDLLTLLRRLFANG